MRATDHLLIVDSDGVHWTVTYAGRDRRGRFLYRFTASEDERIARFGAVMTTGRRRRALAYWAGIFVEEPLNTFELWQLRVRGAALDEPRQK